MKKNKIMLALSLVLITSMSVLADGETGQSTRSIIEIICDELGNIIQYIYG